MHGETVTTRDNQFLLFENGKRRRLAVNSEYIHRIQRRHFLLFDVIPLILTLFAIVLAFYYPITPLDIILFAVMWLLTGLGITAGYHRQFAHQSFKATDGVLVLLTILGSMAGRGSMISWAAMHRRHHEVSDQPGDMHSPNLHGSGVMNRLRGFFHAHYSWMLKHEYPNVAHYTPDLLKNRKLVWASGNYLRWVVLGLAIPTVVGGLVSWSWMGALTGFLWGGAVRMLVVEQSMSALNSFLHTVGSRRFQTIDNSRNNTILGVLTWGEGWHNNHHAFPNSASFALARYPMDLGYWLIALLEWTGLAWDVRPPTQEQIDRRAAVLSERYGSKGTSTI